MGQKGSKIVVAENCLRPHHAHKCSDVDLKKLRAFIKTGKLAPCFIPYEGEDWRSRELEECPICFLAYPALNRTKCCGKEICTECFLQVKLPNGNRGGALCPFCKAEFSVMFRGAQTAEERAASHAEEQRITEATLRAREAENARNEEKALQLKLNRAGQIEKGERCEIISLEDRVSSPVARRSLFTDDKQAVEASPPRRSGDIDQDALAVVLDSLNLSEYIPSRITAPNTSDIEDAMLQQAIQASLEDSLRQSSTRPSPAGSVHPGALAFSPRGSQALDADFEATNSSSGQMNGQQTSTEEPQSSTRIPLIESERWEDIELRQTEPPEQLPTTASHTDLETAYEAVMRQGDAAASPGATACEAASSACTAEADMPPALGPLSLEAASSRPMSPFNPLNTISSCSMETILTGDMPRLTPLSDGATASSFLPPLKLPCMSGPSPEGLQVLGSVAELPDSALWLECSNPSHSSAPAVLPARASPSLPEPASTSRGLEEGVGPLQASLRPEASLPALIRQLDDHSEEAGSSPARLEPCKLPETRAACVPLVDEKIVFKESPRGRPAESAAAGHLQQPSLATHVSSGQGLLGSSAGNPELKAPAASRTSSAISLDQRLERLLAAGRSSNDESLDSIPAHNSSPRPSEPSDKLPTAPASLQRQAISIAEDHRREGQGTAGMRRRGGPGVARPRVDRYRGSPLRPALVRQGSSSASSTDELIAALHSSPPPCSPRSAAKTPLPAPPIHLKAFLSGGKRFASPLSGRTLTSGSSSREERKGPSFADLLSGKSKSFRTPRRDSFEKHGMRAQEPLTVAMVRAGSPSGNLRAQKLRDEPLRASSPSRLAAAGSPVGSRGRLQDQAAHQGVGEAEAPSQGSVLYEEPASNSFMSLNKGGGAVFLSQPDGSTQLVLLTPDQQQQIEEAQALKHGARELDTPDASPNDHDLRLQEKIRRADTAMQKLYLQLQDQQRTSSSREALSREGTGEADSFAERLRRADEEFKGALEKRDAATRIAAQPSLDAQDAALQRRIADNDAALRS